MSIIKRIDKEAIEALKAGEKERVTVLRGLKSDLKYKQISLGKELTEQQALDVLTSCGKKRRESIELFRSAGREDLATKEEFELSVIAAYLPEQMSEDKVRELVVEAIKESGADSPQKMGLVMKVLMPKVKGKADGKMVSKMVTELLAK